MSEKSVIKSSGPGKVRRAFLIDISPFTPGLVRRVLVNEFGGVFVPTYGWSHLQDSYKLIVLPGEVEMFDHKLDRYWYEKRAWQNDAWSWCHSYKMPSFTACRMDDEGFVFAA